ncbi:hypothetical protein Q4I28_005769 [Leishmania naiffi]|uniref:Chromatin target of PRMT1 protein C-terminal domain-containing protein n=1 Tax=Leishmania naiffi TaxID=5678 RepID=A0AAW3BE54_9TRYP
MARDDFDRRRLRALYDRKRRRVSALADARARRRGGEDDYSVPRRYVVSECRTRMEGFGRGGTQVRRVVRRARGDRSDESRRFSGRGIFRSSGGSRFRRADDFEREERRARFREERARRLGGQHAEGRHFGVARRMRLRMRGTHGGRGNRHLQESSRPNNGNSRGNRGSNAQANQVRSSKKPQRSREPQITREELDRQLDNYRN